MNTARNLRNAVSAYSLTALQLEARFESIRAASATGFLYLVDEQFYVVTNWHVVTGRHSETGKHLDRETLIEPDRLCAWFLSAWEPLQFLPVEIPLFDDPDRIHPRWLVHPSLGRRVDAVALLINASIIGEMLAANRIAEQPIALAQGDDVFILGFPRGLTGGLQFPIWKRGSIASVPALDWRDLPAILIDAATREGMSGAPVIAQSNHVVLGTDLVIEGTSEMSMFIGIYSGRLGASQIKAQLGIVWRAEAIDEIVAGKRKGTRED